MPRYEDAGEKGIHFHFMGKTCWTRYHVRSTGPYQYIIYRSNDLWGRDLQEIYGSFTTSDLNDTTFTDHPVEYRQFPYSYSVELYNNAPGNRFLIGRPEVASTIYPEASIGDNKIYLNFKKNVPWLNTTLRHLPAEQQHRYIRFTRSSQLRIIIPILT